MKKFFSGKYESFKERIKFISGLDVIFATWFYSGLIPVAPGTFGSIAAFPIYYAVITWCSPDMMVPTLYYICAALFLIGLWNISIIEFTFTAFI